jgi:16S rRNA processing protein RimM
MTTHITIATFGGSFGVKGEVRIKSFCAVPEDIENYAPLTTPDGHSFDGLTLTGRIKGGFSARVIGVTTKEQADALKGVEIRALRSQLPSLPDDEYYYADLTGLAVHDTGGALLGAVKSVLNHGAADLLEVLPVQGGETVLLPFTLALIPTVDLKAGRIVADPPEGLFADG